MKTQNNPTAIGEKINRVVSGWEQFAPGAAFAGFTLDQFKESVGPSLEARSGVANLEAQLRGARRLRDNADKTSIADVLNVVNSVRGNPEYGENSELYESFGYKPKDDYASGLTRKSDEPQPVELLKAA